jgi:hypothetical protein
MSILFILKPLIILIDSKMNDIKTIKASYQLNRLAIIPIRTNFFYLPDTFDKIHHLT